MSDDHLADISHEHLTVRPVARLAGGHRPRRNGASGDLGLARPFTLLALLGVKRRPVQGEAGIAPQISALAGRGHRTEADIAVGELAFDARDAGRAVSPQGGDRLVSAGLEQPPHPLGELRFRLLDRLPVGHRAEAYSGGRTTGGTIRNINTK